MEEKIIITDDGKIGGKSITQKREEIVNQLQKDGFLLNKSEIMHMVGVHERCGTPMEIIPITQWFVKMLEIKEELLKRGEEITWYPKYMKQRYVNWINGLKWDWCISRERYFGVPIPAFFCKSCEKVVLPRSEDLPIDPKTDKKYLKCDCGGELKGEKDFFDTWFTSSQTPEINNAHQANGSLKGKMVPMSMRAQAHDIIRTWATYTILMSHYKDDSIPWKEIVISGHILAKKGEKISKKTGGGVYKPEEMVTSFSADAIRYAMSEASLGKDVFFEEEQVNNGKRLVNKLFNAAKYILKTLSDFDPQGKDATYVIDKWILNEMHKTSMKMKKCFSEYEFGKALIAFEEFFWKLFADNYLEIVKTRAQSGSREGMDSAGYTLFHVYFGILKMISPFMPHITEEIYHSQLKNPDDEKSFEIEGREEGGYYNNFIGVKSIHLTDWITDDYEIDPSEKKAAELLIEAVSLMRKEKNARGIKLGDNIPLMKIITGEGEELVIDKIREDLMNVSRTEKIEIAKSTDPADFSITI